MKNHKIEAWVDDGLHLNFMYPGAGAAAALYVSVNGESMAEDYQTLFVDKTLGAIADISAIESLRGDLERKIDLEEQVWTKIQELEAEFIDNLTTAEWVAAEMGGDGSRFTGYDGVDLDELCDIREGRLIEVHANQRRYKFADGSGVLISEDSWDLALDPRCWCRTDDGHDPENCEILNDA